MKLVLPILLLVYALLAPYSSPTASVVVVGIAANDSPTVLVSALFELYTVVKYVILHNTTIGNVACVVTNTIVIVVRALCLINLRWLRRNTCWWESELPRPKKLGLLFDHYVGVFTFE